MVHTVGLVGASGYIGAPTLKLLAQSAIAGKIILVVLHRPGRVPSVAEDKNIELRVFDPQGDVTGAVRGINVLISAVAFGAQEAEITLVDELARSPDIVTFFPSFYTSTWTAEEEAKGALGELIRLNNAGARRAKEKDVGVTTVYTGVFDNYFFEMGFVGAAVKSNAIWANEKQLENRIPVTTAEHLAQALNDLATTVDPSLIKNTKHSVVTYWPTGKELQALYSKINGKPAEIKPFTKESSAEVEADMDMGGPIRAGYFAHWETDSWGHETEGRVYDGEAGASLEQTARKYA